MTQGGENVQENGETIVVSPKLMAAFKKAGIKFTQKAYDDLKGLAETSDHAKLAKYITSNSDIADKLGKSE